ncbi:hypothetical protein M8818_006788 [Zalaria obscura]|uniref:Uncharacterized protein n=1 Tax=Zalaria obscura TaxID=2024903 RepID=A0ACC3S5Z0_9PEZI
MNQSGRRFVDQFEHQQNETAEGNEQRSAGGHWGPQQGEQHKTATGAAGAAVSHIAGREEDPSFRPDRTYRPEQTERPVSHQQREGQPGVGEGPQVLSTTDNLEVLCGPLLNYRRMSGEHTDNPIWHGSVLVVTTPGQRSPQLRLEAAGAVNGQSGAVDFRRTVSATKLYEDPRSAFWQFDLEVPFMEYESRWTYEVHGMCKVSATAKSIPGTPKTFAIPAKTASMRILFHSCNGFSVGTDTAAWSGCALWNDVIRFHEKQPFHVMIGGGDQIYNDGVRVDGPLKPWSDIGNPKRRRDFPFNEELRAKCDEYYFNNYVRWYNIEPFCEANGQIPQLNIWDDHDIIDGFGSYTDHFMKCAVFRGIGGVAHKYYMLFQHHIPPPQSTFTTDAPSTLHANANGTTGADAVQLKDTWVMQPTKEDPSYIIGHKPGPYVEERSRSIYCQLGARMAFVGIDARTERTRHQINYNETYDQIFARASAELAASNGAIKHLILLLGVPIAYPRLQWLENILQSPIIGPIRFLNKRFGLAGGFFNHFDGGVDLLDDLDDHYTAHQHKRERRELVQRLQKLAKQHSVRVTILSGDVHLAALGRFYSHPKLEIPAERDWRYMPNVVSSAITNKPPPSAVANLLARRNKIHHLDAETDETLLNLFDRNPGEGTPGVGKKTADKNHCTMPSRNYAVIAESHDLAGSAAPLNGGPVSDVQTNGHAPGSAPNGVNSAGATPHFAPAKNPRDAISAGEKAAGSAHPAASGTQRTGLAGDFGLDVTFRVEISPSDREGRTEGYGFSIPALDARAYSSQGTKW